MRMYSLSICCMVALLLKLTAAQQCATCHQKFPYWRTVNAFYNGAPDVRANESTVKTVLGSCTSTETLVNELIERFGEYEIDLNPVRENPYKAYFADEFILSPLLRDPSCPITVISSTLAQYSRFVNGPMYSMAWYLTAQENINTPRGTIPAGCWMMFGNFRFELYGLQMCVSFMSRLPVQLIGNKQEGFVAMDLILKNELLGEGTAIGLQTWRNGSLAERFVMTFQNETRRT